MNSRILACIKNMLCVIIVAAVICMVCYWSIVYYPFDLTGQAKLTHLLLIGFTFLFSIASCVVSIIMLIITEVKRRWYERELREHYQRLQKNLQKEQDEQKC